VERKGDGSTLTGSGCLAYSGSPEGLLPHFNAKTYADVFGRLANGGFEAFQGQVGESLSFTSSTDSSGGSASRIPDRPQDSRRDDDSLWSWNGILHAAIPGNSWQQMLFVAWRALLLVIRDRGLLATMVAQPLVLGLLVCLTQFAPGGIAPLAFFSAVITIWLGMNNGARDLVRERTQYVRERLAGLHPEAYLGAKWCVFTVAGMVQILLLLIVLRLGCKAIMPEMHYADLRMPIFFVVLSLCYQGGLAFGFLVSTVVRTEEAAVAALPLLIIPQLLLSVVATGHANELYSKPRPCKPLVVTLTSEQELPVAARLVDGLSLLCFSRPATLLLEAPGVKGYGRESIVHR